MNYCKQLFIGLGFITSVSLSFSSFASSSPPSDNCVPALFIMRHAEDFDDSPVNNKYLNSTGESKATRLWSMLEKFLRERNTQNYCPIRYIYYYQRGAVIETAKPLPNCSSQYQNGETLCSNTLNNELLQYDDYGKFAWSKSKRAFLHHANTSVLLVTNRQLINKRPTDTDYPIDQCRIMPSFYIGTEPSTTFQRSWVYVLTDFNANENKYQKNTLYCERARTNTRNTFYYSDRYDSDPNKGPFPVVEELELVPSSNNNPCQ
jgi:hypothetical protein